MTSILQQVADDAVAKNNERWKEHLQQVAMCEDGEPTYADGIAEGRAIARRTKVKWWLFGWASGTVAALIGQTIWFLTR